MGLFDRTFGRWSTSPDSGERDAQNATEGAAYSAEDMQPTPSQPIHGPPEFVHAVDMQRAYWTHNADEQAQLEARGAEQLAWRERLRLHHLTCMQLINHGTQRAAATEKCRESARRLVEADSPYRRRPAMVWQGQSAQPDADREPDMQGEFLNPSITHFGCLEVYRVDAANQPTGLDFVSFDELSGVVFAPPNQIRAAKLFYNDSRGEIVLVPLLYGLTWAIGNEYDRTGQRTRFVAHLDAEEICALGATGIGVGQQDLSIRSKDGASTLFGLGSVTEISFPLDMRDQRFDEKARVRGIDPDEVRARMGRG